MSSTLGAEIPSLSHKHVLYRLSKKPPSVVPPLFGACPKHFEGHVPRAGLSKNFEGPVPRAGLSQEFRLELFIKCKAIQFFKAFIFIFKSTILSETLGTSHQGKPSTTPTKTPSGTPQGKPNINPSQDKQNATRQNKTYPMWPQQCNQVSYLFLRHCSGV